MVYIIDITWDRPFQQSGSFMAFEEKYPDPKELIKFVHVWRDGKKTPKLTADQVPRKIALTGLRKTSKIPDAFRTRDGLPLVSDALRSLIEKMDPGFHQFFPVELSLPKGREPETGYNIIIVTESKTSIIPELSEVQLTEYGDYRFNYGHPKIVFSPECRSGANIWREEKFDGRLFISDKLDNEIRSQGLKYYRRWKGEIAE